MFADDQMKDSEDQEGVSSVEDQSSVKSDDLHHHCSKIKIMCSYGGRILPRPHDGQLRYVGGEKRILLWNRGISFLEMVSKLVNLVGRNFVTKYQLPNEDMDALISVVSEEDFVNMIDEYEKMERRDGCATRLSLFLFPAATMPQQLAHASSGDESSSRSIEQQFIEAVNGMVLSSGKKPLDDQSLELHQQQHLKLNPVKMQRQLSAPNSRTNSGNLIDQVGGSAAAARNSPKSSPKAQEGFEVHHQVYYSALGETENGGGGGMESPKKQKAQQQFQQQPPIHHHSRGVTSLPDQSLIYTPVDLQQQLLRPSVAPCVCRDHCCRSNSMSRFREQQQQQQYDHYHLHQRLVPEKTGHTRLQQHAV